MAGIKPIAEDDLTLEPHDPSYVQFDDVTNPFEFMVVGYEVQEKPMVSIVDYDAKLLKKHPPSHHPGYHQSTNKWENHAPVLLTGRTASGVSVSVFVHGFLYRMAIRWNHEWDVDTFRNCLMKAFHLKEDELECRLEEKLLMWGYHEKKEPILYCYFASPGRLRQVKWKLSTQAFDFGFGEQKLEIHEHDVNIATQLCIATQGKSCGWLRISVARCFEKNWRYTHQRVELHVQLTGDERFDSSNVLRPVDRADIAPLLIASFDIEVKGQGAHFANAENEDDFIFAINISVAKPDGKIVKRYCLYYGVCGNFEVVRGRIAEREKQIIRDKIAVVGSKMNSANDRHRKQMEEEIEILEKQLKALDKFPVEMFDVFIQCSSEYELLETFRNVVVFDINPDELLGHNIAKFDCPYLWARQLMLACVLFLYFGRIIGEQMKVDVNDLDTAALGDNRQEMWDISGRIMVDSILELKRNNIKLASYGLNDVAEAMLDLHKIEMDYEYMNNERQRNTDPEKGAEFAIYCGRDCDLPIFILIKKALFIGNIEMARATHVPLKAVLGRGQQIKAYGQVCVEAHNLGYVVNKGIDLIGHYGDSVREINRYEYSGATVLEPLTGYYADPERPTTTLDFASLYPSLMQAHNLCPTTLLMKPFNTYNLAESDVERVECDGRNHIFVKNHVRRGLLPRVLDKLLAQRKIAKTEMAKYEEGSAMYGIYDGRQNAYKVSANSIYGLCGFEDGKFGIKPIAESVTRWGRESLKIAQEKASEKLPGVTIIYGVRRKQQKKIIGTPNIGI